MATFIEDDSVWGDILNWNELREKIMQSKDDPRIPEEKLQKLYEVLK